MRRLDGLKIYPTLFIRVTGLCDYGGIGYNPNELIDIAAKSWHWAMARVYRVQRVIHMPIILLNQTKALRNLYLLA